MDFELETELDSARVTAADLIHGRVMAELARVGGRVPRPIVAISDLDLSINGGREAGELDPEREVMCALAAFERGRFVLIVAGRQISALTRP